MDTASRPGSNILIVDDEPSVRDLLFAILSEKYTCTGAASAEQALSFLEHETFDLVISDINMGGMSGIELISRAVASSPDTVVMMISGNQTIDSPIEAIRSGAFDYLRKPFDIDQVEIAVDRAITHAELLVSKRKHEDNLEQLVAERTGRLNFLAYNDPLTRLPNRASFEEKLSRILSERRPESRVAVFFVSLDRFKGLRDTLGHTTSDRLLKEVADRLDGLTSKDVSTARFGGDEFILLLTNKTADEISSFADVVSKAFEASFSVGEYNIFISISIGISQTPDGGDDAQTLLRNAGAALSHARNQGGSKHQFYTSGIHEKAVKRLALENDLRKALKLNEFELYYQPKIDINTEQVVGMEALIRWNHPDFGLIPPMDFIPLAEETGFILPLGEWILRTACTQTKIWHDKGFELNVAVNISAAQFQQKDLARKIAAIVHESGLEPQFLNLEITESSIMNDTIDAIEVLQKLRKMGMTISIDDFGTGHSSLQYLKHLPMDVLKIDKSFVDDVTTNPDDAAIVMAIVTLAHSLRLKVVAEGVETEEQLNFLQLLTCDEWQGYLFSKPVQTEAFERLLVKPEPIAQSKKSELRGSVFESNARLGLKQHSRQTSKIVTK